MMSDHEPIEIIDTLRKQAQEIADACHAGWGNTMTLAAERIEELEAQLEAERAVQLAQMRDRIALQSENKRLHEDFRIQQDKIISQADEIKRLKDAILWALGETDPFPTRKEGDPFFWWRKELRKRAMLEKGDEQEGGS